MSKKGKKISELKNADEVALYVDSKKSLQNNEVTITKPASVIYLTWYAAKAALEKGEIDGRKVKLAGYVETDENHKQTAHPLVDDTNEDYALSEAEDKSTAEKDAELEAKVISMAESMLKTVLEKSQKDFEEREKALSARELAVSEQITKANEIVENAGVKDGTQSQKTAAEKKAEKKQAEAEKQVADAGVAATTNLGLE